MTQISFSEAFCVITPSVCAVEPLGAVPQWQQPLPLLVARHYGPMPPERLRENLFAAPFKTEQSMRSVWVPYVSLIGHLCNDAVCITRLGADLRKDLISWDYRHFTPRGTRRHSDGQALNAKVKSAANT